MCLIRNGICGKMSSNLNSSVCHMYKMYVKILFDVELKRENLL